MNIEIIDKLNKLEKKILSKDLISLTEKTEEWGGADVIIAGKTRKKDLKWLGNENIVISLQESIPKKRLVVTKYAKELSWLFFQLRDIFYENIDFISKHDFYGSLAQSAIDYININKRNLKANELLLWVLNTSRNFV